MTRGHLVLMVRRERSGAIRWELPSGLLEPRESFEEAAKRETLEETGIPVEVGPLLCTVVMDVPVEHYRGVNVYFHASAPAAGQPRIGRDEPICEVRFVDLAGLKSREIHPVDRRILDLWRRRPDRPPYYVHITL